MLLPEPDLCAGCCAAADSARCPRRLGRRTFCGPDRPAQALRDGPWRVIDRESMQTDAEREQAAHDCLSADFFLTGRECRQPYGRTGEYRRQGKPRCCHRVRSARDHRDRRMNKVVDTLDEAVHRARTIAAPKMSSASSAKRRARRPAAAPTATVRNASAIRSSSREIAAPPGASMSSSSARSLASEQNRRKKSEPPLSERGLRVLPRVSRLLR